jgi:hypothetical protein
MIGRFEGMVFAGIGPRRCGFLANWFCDFFGRNHLAHRTGDAINAVLAAAGYNFHLLLKWLQLLLSRFLAVRKTAAALQRI